MKKYVFIQAEKAINVTSGLDLENVTNPSLPVKDNMKIKPLWPTTTVMLLEGKHIYPSIVAEFKTVKSLEKQGFLTIGKDTDELPEEDRQRVIEIERRLRKLTEKKEAKKTTKTVKKVEETEE